MDKRRLKVIISLTVSTEDHRLDRSSSEKIMMVEVAIFTKKHMVIIRDSKSQINLMSSSIKILQLIDMLG